jgi:hypothetical protein
MFALFSQRMLVEFGLFRFTTLEDAFSVVRTCRAASSLRPRPLAASIKTFAQLRGVWPLLGAVKTLCLLNSDNDAETAEWLRSHPLPASLRELQSCHEVDLGLDLQVLLLHFWPRDLKTTIESLRQLHTLRIASVRDITRQEATLISHACPQLKEFACFAMEDEDPEWELQLEALSLEVAGRLPAMATLKRLRIRKLDYLKHDEAGPAFARLHRLERLDLGAKGRNSILLASNLAQLIRLESLSLENYRVVWDHELPSRLLSLSLLGVGMVPVERFRGMTKLQSAALANEFGCELLLPPSLVDLTLFQVGEPFAPLRVIDLANFESLDLNVWGLEHERLDHGTDDRANERRAAEWESLFARLPSLSELALSWPALRTMGNRVGPQFRAILNRLRRLKLGWALELADFIDAILAATGPQLRQLVVTASQPCEAHPRMPERLLAGLDLLEIAGKVLVPRPSMTPPENFLRVQVNKIFGT